MELSAASRSHDGGTIETVNLSYPQSKLVRNLGCHTGDGEVNMLEAHTWFHCDKILHLPTCPIKEPVYLCRDEGRSVGPD